MEKIARYAESHPLVRVLDSLSKFGILIAAIIWVAEVPNRQEDREQEKKANLIRAWEILAQSELLALSPARKNAVDLIIKNGGSMERSELSWAALDNGNYTNISFKESYLREINFNGAKLVGANFSFAVLNEVDFSRADLTGAKFYGALCIKCDFSTAINFDKREADSMHLVNVKGLGKSENTPPKEVIESFNKRWSRPSQYYNAGEIKNDIKSAGS